MNIYLTNKFAKAKNYVRENSTFAIVFLSFATILSLSFFYKASIPYLTNLISRETQNDNVAKEFFYNGIDLFYPRSYAVPPPNNYQALDFPVLEALVSVGYHIFGETVVVAKTINVIAFLLAEIIFFSILNRLSQDKWFALLATAISSTGYMSFFYTATFMLEPFALSLAMLTVNFAIRYIEKEKVLDLLMFFFLGLLTTLVKVFMLIPFCFSILLCFLLFNKTKQIRQFLTKSLPLAGSVILWILSLFAWFKHVESLSRKTSILYLPDSLAPSFLTTKTSFLGAWQILTTDVLTYFSIFPVFLNSICWLLFCVVGGVTLLLDRKKTMLLNGFVFGNVLGFAFVFFSFNNAMDHTYYYMPLMFGLPSLAAWGVIKVIKWISPVILYIKSLVPGVLRTPQVVIVVSSAIILLLACFWESLARSFFSIFNNQPLLYSWSVDSSLKDKYFYWIATGVMVINLSWFCLYLYKSKISRETVSMVSIASFIVLIGIMIYPVHISQNERYYHFSSSEWMSNTLNGVFLKDTHYVKEHTTRDDVLIIVSGRGQYYPEFLYYADRVGYEWSYDDFYCYLHNNDSAACLNKVISMPDKIFIEYTRYNYSGGVLPAKDELLEWFQSSRRVTLVNVFATKYDDNTILYELDVKKNDSLVP